MHDRDLLKPIHDLALADGKMALISGPRQVGKTTLARQLMNEFPQASYFNWDQLEFRRVWAKTPSQVVQFQDENKEALVVLDEIHKATGWKSRLKGIYDTRPHGTGIVVTGSARLNHFKKGGDSLMGRYLHFRLNPFTLSELEEKPVPSPEAFRRDLGAGRCKQEALEMLLRLSGFPDPLFKASEQKHLLWQRNRVDQVIREDLRDLSRILDLGKVQILASIMPEKVGSPLSVQSLREDLETSHETVTRWLQSLAELYYFFALRPYSKKIVRSLKKEQKIYLYDWTEVKEPGPRFENLVALHFLKLCQYWTDTGQGTFELFYLRDKEKREVDFLICENRSPWLSVEAKLSAGLDRSFMKFQQTLGCPHLQITFQDGVFKRSNEFTAPVYEISANRVF